MYKDPYLILQVSEGASEEEINAAYESLKRQYTEQMFLPGEAGAEAARKLTELEEAYREVKSTLESKRAEADYGSRFGVIEEKIKQNKINEAQQMLDEIMDRNAEWHYLQSIIFYKKSWYNESKAQLEIAASMEPGNPKYRDALNRLNVFMSGQAKQQGYRQADAQYGPQEGASDTSHRQYGRGAAYDDRQMGGICGAPGTAENCCLQLICADCCCECLGGDLILCC
jgi:DnaJ-class molecular chaperone